MKKVGGMSQVVMNDFKHACVTSICLAFFLLVIFIDWDPIFHGRFFTIVSEEEPGSSSSEVRLDWSQESHVESPSVRKLIEDIRATTRVAAGGVYKELTAEEEAEWRLRNPCRSRMELMPLYDRRKFVRKLPRDLVFEQVLDEYSKLHRTCRVKIGPNVTDFFMRNITVPGCRFVLGNPMYGTGLGNKMIVTASALLYAILTQRVLLVPFRTNLPSFMCEPFVGSSWMLDSSTFPMPDGKVGTLPWLPPEEPDYKIWVKEDKFLPLVDHQLEQQPDGKLNRDLGDQSHHDSLQPPPPLTYAMTVTVRWKPPNRFYCPTEQYMLSEVPWMYWGGCIYAMPKLFSSPIFGSTLSSLFPDKMVMTRLLRSALLPGDIVFDKATKLNDQYFQQADRRVGIQLRSLHGKAAYDTNKDAVNRRILNCVLGNELLPNVSSSLDEDDNLPVFSTTKVFIASLYNGLHDYLSDFYFGKPTVTGEEVDLIQVTSNEEQKLSVEEDIQAYVEILLLSLSDQLLVTPSSTFGSIAQAYGAITPWFIETREDTNTTTYGSCERAQSIDICHQFADINYDCPYDSAINGKVIFDEVSGIKPCLDIDHTAGLQLISTFQSDM